MSVLRHAVRVSLDGSSSTAIRLDNNGTPPPPTPRTRRPTDEGDHDGKPSGSSISLSQVWSMLATFATVTVQPSCAQCAAVLGAADLLLQSWGSADSGIDYRSTSKKVMYGVLKGVIAAVWYTVIERLFPGAGLAAVFTKILLDVSVGNCLFNSAYLLGMPALGGEAHTSLPNLTHNLAPAMKSYFAFWPVPTALTFLVVPPAFRSAFLLGCGFAWELSSGMAAAPAAAPACAAFECVSGPSTLDCMETLPTFGTAMVV